MAVLNTVEVVMVIKHFLNNRLTVTSRFTLLTGPAQAGAHRSSHF